MAEEPMVQEPRAKEWRLRRRPHGYPRIGDVELAEVPVVGAGRGQVLVRNRYLSVDPYMRGRMDDASSYAPSYRLGEAMWGAAVGEVVESKDTRLPVGTAVRHSLGWRTHSVLRHDQIDTVPAAEAAYLGVLGMPGLTAWVGLYDIAELRPAETVWVSAASGAVGSLAAQLAKLVGCRVIGSAGGAEKARSLVEDLGLDAGINYHGRDLEQELREAAPDGIDVYFENVGGEHLHAALALLKPFGRIAACGMIAGYNEAQPGPNNLALIVRKKLSIRGFIVSDHMHRQAAFERHVAPLVNAGRIHHTESIVRGIDTMFDAFVGMLRTNSHVGKLVIKL